MADYYSKLLKCLIVQVLVLTLCSAYPYAVDSDYEDSDLTMRPTKRAFDRLEGNEFGLFKRAHNKRSFDRLDMADFGLRRKRAFDRIARAEFGLTGLRKKRSFNQILRAPFDLSRKKRSLDRIGISEFGLIKRSPDLLSDRDELVDDVMDSFLSLGDSPALEDATPSVFLTLTKFQEK